MKRKEFSLIIFLFILILVVTLSLSRKGRKSVWFQVSGLDDYLNPFTNKQLSTEIIKYENDTLLGTVYNELGDEILFTTYGLFTYDIAKSQFIYYEYKDNKRILDFSLLENNLVYVEIEHNQEEYNWSVWISDLNFDHKQKILDGRVINVFNYPKLFRYEDDVFVTYINDSYSEFDDVSEEYGLYSVGKKRQIMSCAGSLFHQNGILSFGIRNNRLVDGKLYYTIVDESNTQSLMVYDITGMDSKALFSLKEGNNMILSYCPFQDGVYIQTVDAEKCNNPVIYCVYPDHVESVPSDIILTFEEQVYDGMILSHVEGDRWVVFDCHAMTFNVLSSNQLNLLPKYVYLGNGKIQVCTKSKCYLTGQISLVNE